MLSQVTFPSESSAGGEHQVIPVSSALQASMGFSGKVAGDGGRADEMIATAEDPP